MWLDHNEARRTSYQPPLLLTGITIQGGMTDLAVNDLDTLFLSPAERSLTIHFAALDYTDPHAVSYQFMLGTDTTTHWNNIGHDHVVTLLDLKPGTYRLSLRSTNANGQWTDNVRTLTIVVEPTFWETPWAILLIVVIALAVIGAVIYTLLYIRRIKRKQQETLTAYLELLDQNAESTAVAEQHTDSDATQSADHGLANLPIDDPFMQRVLAYVEQNIGNSDTDISQMAEACAVSRSVLQRKVKQAMGVTPADFMREARLKRACQLLKKPDSIVSEVAYRCGFSDPKYFSRCFKQSFGMSPSDYKQQKP